MRIYADETLIIIMDSLHGTHTDDPTCTRLVGPGKSRRHRNLRSSKPLSRSVFVSWGGAAGSVAALR